MLWVARDSNGCLMLYVDEKPIKGKLCWHVSDYEGKMIALPKELMPEVQWLDKEPKQVELKGI